MSLESAAHKAVHDALTALAGGRIFDRVPAKDALAPYPYLVVRVDVRDDANTCSNASEVHVTVNVFSNAVGSQEAEELGGQVRELLAPDDPDETLAIDGYVTSVAAFDIATYRAAESPLVTEGVLAFTYLVDPDPIT
jgi:hypothetical protein